MSITKLAVSLASPLPKLESFDRYLFIGPHPDDIEIGAGATAAKLVSAGKNVAFLCCIDGRYGSGTVPPEALIPIRRAKGIGGGTRRCGRSLSPVLRRRILRAQ